jgi:hypothetical protein
MSRQISFAWLLALFLHSLSSLAAPVVRYPIVSADDPQVQYVSALLGASLAYSGKAYQLLQAPATMQQARAIQEVRSEHGTLDLLWTMTSAEREAEMLPIKIPIDKGLMGWRIALVKNGQSELFQHVKNAQDLRAYKAGQEHDWPDTAILKSNGLPVVTSTSYEALFNMLDGDRFDYFPRSVLEIRKELDAHPSHAMSVEQTLVLHYPAAMYFFVSPHRPELAEDLRQGLEKMIADGSLL